MSEVGEPDRTARRAAAAAKPAYECECGRTPRSNVGIKQHQRHCTTHLERVGWPLDELARTALRKRHGPEIVAAVEREMGRWILERRRAGDLSDPPWEDRRNEMWGIADRLTSKPEGADG